MDSRVEYTGANSNVVLDEEVNKLLRVVHNKIIIWDYNIGIIENLMIGPHATGIFSM